MRNRKELFNMTKYSYEKRTQISDSMVENENHISKIRNKTRISALTTECSSHK